MKAENKEEIFTNNIEKLDEVNKKIIGKKKKTQEIKDKKANIEKEVNSDRAKFDDKSDDYNIRCRRIFLVSLVFVPVLTVALKNQLDWTVLQTILATFGGMVATEIVEIGIYAALYNHLEKKLNKLNAPRIKEYRSLTKEEEKVGEEIKSLDNERSLINQDVVTASVAEHNSYEPHDFTETLTEAKAKETPKVLIKTQKNK